MENSIEEFLASQKTKLEKDKNRLQYDSPRSQCSRSSSAGNRKISTGNTEILDENFLQNEIFDKSRKVSGAKSDYDYEQTNDLNLKLSAAPSPGPASAPAVCPFDLYDNITKTSLKSEYSLNKTENFLNKNEKNLKNERQTRSLDRGVDLHPQEALQKDVMEQWVSDTFYSYFPSFNQYNKKKQELARDRHIEYQNYLKQAANIEPKKKTNRIRDIETNNADSIFQKPDNIGENTDNINGSPIFNDNTARPGSAKQKLLEDLKHTDLVNILTTDAIDKRNRRSAENEVKKKLEYQRDLMRQIEEKRREVELIREREKQEEELLTKRLEEQIKTMKLEEELEKETLKSEKMRIASEQNKILRAHLLSKLETENKRFTPLNNQQETIVKRRHTQSEGAKETNDQDQNKVYKYFSNSARNPKCNKYGRRKYIENYESDSSQADVEIPILDSDHEEISSRRCKSYQSTSTQCTFCKSELKIFDNYCTKCKIRITEDVTNYYKRCENCKDRFYICSDCEKRFIPCMLCHQHRNFCFDCMRNLCMNCQRPAREHHVSSAVSDITTVSNEIERNKSVKKSMQLTTKKSFKVLDDENYVMGSSRIKNKSDKEKTSPSNSLQKTNRLPYSMNYDDNSIFHPENKVIEPKIDVLLRNDKTLLKSGDENRRSLEIIKHKTNDRLSRYVQNYGDLRVKNANTSRIAPGKVHVENVYLAVPRSSAALQPKESASKIPINKANILHDQNPVANSYITTSKITKGKLPGMQQRRSMYNEYETFTQVGVIRKQLEEQFKNSDTV